MTGCSSPVRWGVGELHAISNFLCIQLPVLNFLRLNFLQLNFLRLNLT
jgi:hypothetical protein